ncbi:sialate O-acetylesterase, partial [Bacteroidota bacterium]
TDIDVPIGLINTTWGGSRLEPWMNAESLGLDEAAVAKIRSDVDAWEESIRQELESRIGELPEEDRGYENGVAIWASPDLDDTGWNLIEVPGTWEQGGYPGMDGIGWYRTTFELSEDEAANGVILGVGMIDDSDVTWVNGHRVGGMEMAYNRPREYDVAAEALRTGTNVVSIWVEDTGGGGGIYGDPSLLFLDVGRERLSLAGTWKFEVGRIDVNLEGFNNQVPTLLYNKMIYPIIDYPIVGALWYQGESNAGPEDAFEYRSLFKTMISQWREDWGIGDFPFLFVQLANYMEARDQPVESNWALLRESQGEALSLPNTAQAVTIDIGEAADIHPRNKKDVGLRLALAARSVYYNEEVVYSGPVQRSYTVQDGKVYIEFDHIGEGLELRDVPEGISGFAVAGPDSQFVWANSVLDGDKVVVWNDTVADPVAVRYAWADNPLGANLYNTAGLPASPFRTDEW